MGNLLKLYRDGASSLQFWNLNEEFLVRASHQLALITSLPFNLNLMLYEGLKVSYKFLNTEEPKWRLVFHIRCDIAKLRGSPKALSTAALLKRRVQQVV